MAEVVLEVEVLVVDPDRPSQLERHEADALAITRDEVELRLDHVDEVSEGWLRPFEDGDRPDVHMGDVVLHMQERRVQRTQAVRAHSTSLRRCSGAT